MAIFEIPWNPFDPLDPGPLIRIAITATDETIEAGRAIGLEFPEPLAITGLIDTGATWTMVSQTFARNWKFPLTSSRTPIKTIGGSYFCSEYSCAISFPNSSLPRIETMRILSCEFNRETHHSCLIGRDIIRNWDIRFDGRGKRVVIKA